MTREEAIEVVKERLNYYEREKRLKAACEVLIPELAESEDERIRKKLIEIIGYFRSRGIDQQLCEKFLAYLEKQKEVGIRWFESDNVKNPDKPYIDKVGMFYTTDGRMCHASDIEKQKDILSERATNITANMLEDGIEGIQRELIEFLSNTINAPWIDIIKSADSYAQRIKSMIEKQKDKFASETMAMKDKIDEGFTKFMEKEHKKENLRDFIDNFPYSDEQKEQKPSHKFNVGDTIHCKYDDREFAIKSVDLANGVYKYTKEGCGNDIDYADENFELVEQKPAEWSEEDEDNLNRVIRVLEDNDSDWRELSNWLKSLRPSWKPSEQEKGALRTAIYVLTEERNFSKTAEQLQNILNTFEGEEPRKDWKPSEEQMKALKNSAYGTYQNGDGPVLRGLYEQLEKLM